VFLVWPGAIARTGAGSPAQTGMDGNSAKRAGMNNRNLLA
jgi:hypothetical protein